MIATNTAFRNPGSGQFRDAGARCGNLTTMNDELLMSRGFAAQLSWLVLQQLNFRVEVRRTSPGHWTTWLLVYYRGVLARRLNSGVQPTHAEAIAKANRIAGQLAMQNAIATGRF